MHLTGPVLAQIFLGQITNWDDPAIAALNPHLALPNAPIFVVHRSDGSGTTYIFTSYLSSVDPAWATKVGTGKTVNWPAQSGEGAPGNPGVATPSPTSPSPSATSKAPTPKARPSSTPPSATRPGTTSPPPGLHRRRRRPETRHHLH